MLTSYKRFGTKQLNDFVDCDSEEGQIPGTEELLTDDQDDREDEDEETEIDQLKDEVSDQIVGPRARITVHLKVLSVYEQVRTLISNLRSAKIQGRQSLSLHTSIASSDSSDHLATHFKVPINWRIKETEHRERRFCVNFSKDLLAKRKQRKLPSVCCGGASLETNAAAV